MIPSIVGDNLRFSFLLFAATSALPLDSFNIPLSDSSFHHSSVLTVGLCILIHHFNYSHQGQTSLI